MRPDAAIEAGRRAADADALRVGGDLGAFVALEPLPPAGFDREAGAWWMAGYGAQHVEIVDRLLPADMSIEDYRAMPEAARWRATLRNADERAAGGPE